MFATPEWSSGPTPCGDATFTDEKRAEFDYAPERLENPMADTPNSKPDPTDRNVRLILTWLATHRDSTELELEELGTQLDTLRETPLPPRQSLKLLEMLFACLSTRLEEQITQFAGAGIPLARRIRQQVNTLQDVLEDFALGYEGVLGALSGEAQASELELSLERTAFCLHKHLYISYLVAAPAGLGIWQRLHGTYLRSLEMSPEPGHPRPITAYGEALLLACAQPASFSSQELAFVAEYVRQRAGTLNISARLPAETGGLFWIDPSRDFPAFALARRAPPPDYKVYYFSCLAMAEQAGTHLAALSAGQKARELQLPALADTPAGKGTLRRLASFWGNPGKRRFPRRRQSHRGTLVAGLERLWRMLQTPEAMAEEDFSQWMITNESPDGYALMHLHGKAGRIRVGDIVALRTDAELASNERWQICLVRWALSENPEHIEIGLQVLAPEATPALLAIPSDPGNQGRTSALILPELPPLRNEPVLVVPAGAITDQSRKLLLLIQKANLEIRQVRALEVSEQTGRVEVFTIEADAS